MRFFLNRVVDIVLYDKELVKELINMVKNLKVLDINFDEELLRD